MVDEPRPITADNLFTKCYGVARYGWCSANRHDCGGRYPHVVGRQQETLLLALYGGQWHANNDPAMVDTALGDNDHRTKILLLVSRSIARFTAVNLPVQDCRLCDGCGGSYLGHSLILLILVPVRH